MRFLLLLLLLGLAAAAQNAPRDDDEAKPAAQQRSAARLRDRNAPIGAAAPRAKPAGSGGDGASAAGRKGTAARGSRTRGGAGKGEAQQAAAASDGTAGAFRVGMALAGPAKDMGRPERLPVLKIARGGGSFTLPPGRRRADGAAEEDGADDGPLDDAASGGAGGSTRRARRTVRRAKEDHGGGARGTSAVGSGRAGRVETRQIDSFGFERHLGTPDPMFAKGNARGKMQQGKLANGAVKPRYGSLIGRVVLVPSLDARGVLLHAEDKCQTRQRKPSPAAPGAAAPTASACYYVLIDIRDRPQMTAYVQEDDIVVLQRDARVQVLHPDISRYFDRIVSGMYMRKPGKLELRL